MHTVIFALLLPLGVDVLVEVILKMMFSSTSGAMSWEASKSWEGLVEPDIHDEAAAPISILTNDGY